MDNAGSTKYTMGAAMEIVQENILTFFCLSFMVAGHTKFDPDQLFSNTGCSAPVAAPSCGASATASGPS